MKTIKEKNKIAEIFHKKRNERLQACINDNYQAIKKRLDKLTVEAAENGHCVIELTIDKLLAGILRKIVNKAECDNHTLTLSLYKCFSKDEDLSMAFSYLGLDLDHMIFKFGWN